MDTAKNLDQFYTNPNIAKKCVDMLDLTHYDNVIEPSAGSGNIYTHLPEKSRIGLDLEPKHPEVVKQDFLQYEFPKGSTAVVGNPPFGSRSKLAIEFFNKCAKHASLIAFIVPVSWEKYEVQNKLDKSFKLVASYRLPKNAFIFKDKAYNVNCVWQVWAKESSIDRRIKLRPDTSHPDFSMYLYNNTQEARKYFTYDWDFAVYRQGHKDYSHKIYNIEEIDPKQHWMFFKCHAPKAKQMLMSMDFTSLAVQTVTPGFGKADVVKMYKEMENEPTYRT